MREHETESIKLHLTNLLKIEESKYFENKEEKIFYLEHKVPLIAHYFTVQNEPFYLIFKTKGYGIYFNDIEEGFGICKIDNEKCKKYAEFFDNLAPTVRKFKKAYEKNSLELLLG